MSKTCFCGISKHCGYQIETDMEQHDKIVFEEGYNKAMDKMLCLQKEMYTLKAENAQLHNEAQAERALLDKRDAEVRAKAIDEAIEASAKAICVGCGYLDGYKCTYKGGNCGVSKPMLESVVKALEQLKGGEM